MRTTLTLDDDVVDLIRRRMDERSESMKEAVNACIRASVAPQSGEFEFRTHRMGTPLVPLTKALQLAADLEDEEILRKLALGR